MIDKFIKKVTFKDDTGKKQAYIATFVKVPGGYKISDEDMEQINEAMHKGANWEDASSDENLEEKADKTKGDARVAAHLDAIADAQDNGDDLGKAVDDIVESDAKSPEELNKEINGDDAELYTDEEKMALAIDAADGKVDGQLSVHELDKEDGTHDDNIDISNLANAIRDRWQ